MPTPTIEHVHGAYCTLLEDLGLAHGTPVIEWHESITETVVGRAATSSYDHPVTPPTAAAGSVVLLSIMLEADATVAALNGYTALGESAPVTHATTGTAATYRLALFSIVAPGGPLPAPTFTSGFLDTPWTMVAFDGVEDITAAAFDTLNDAHSAGTPDLEGHHLRVWGTIGVNQHIEAPGDIIAQNNPPADPSASNNINIVIAADDGSTEATVGSTAGWCAAAVSVTFRRVATWRDVPERTAALVEYTAGAGRPTPAQPTQALNLSVTLARALAGDTLPTTGDRFRLTLNAAVAAALGVPEDQRPRFTGEVTDVDIEANGVLSLVKVAALGRRTRLERHPVTMTRPEEADGERVRRILAQVVIGLPLDIGTIDPGTVTLLPDAPNAVSAQQLVSAVSADSLGQLVEHRSGRLDYHDAGHRRGLSSRVTLTGDQHLIRPFTWRQGAATIINDATAAYGPDDDRVTVRVTDPTSANNDTGVGPYGAQLDTRLAGELDAYALLTDLVGRYARPSWYLPSVVVDLFRTAGDLLAVLLELSHGDKITATDLPPDGAFTAGDVFVEGTTETASARSWRLDLVVADPTLAGAGLRWIDLPRFLRWTDVDPGLDWLDLATITDPFALGTPVAGAGDADDSPALIVNGGTAATTSWDYVLQGALP